MKGKRIRVSQRFIERVQSAVRGYRIPVGFHDFSCAVGDLFTYTFVFEGRSIFCEDFDGDCSMKIDGKPVSAPQGALRELLNDLWNHSRVF